MNHNLEKSSSPNGINNLNELFWTPLMNGKWLLVFRVSSHISPSLSPLAFLFWFLSHPLMTWCTKRSSFPISWAKAPGYVRRVQATPPPRRTSTSLTIAPLNTNAPIIQDPSRTPESIWLVRCEPCPARETPRGKDTRATPSRTGRLIALRSPGGETSK